MIPQAYIQAWRQHAPWPNPAQVEQDLIWLGKCKREQAEHSMHLVFRFSPESAPQATLKLNVEINTRKHEALRTTYPRLLT